MLEMTSFHFPRHGFVCVHACAHEVMHMEVRMAETLPTLSRSEFRVTPEPLQHDGLSSRPAKQHQNPNTHTYIQYSVLIKYTAIK